MHRTAAIKGLDAGIYCVTISDCQACLEYYCATVELSSGVSTLPSLRSFRLYPNPVVDQLELELNVESMQTIQLDILDAQGNSMAKKTCQGKDIHLKWDVRTLPAGNYWIRIQSLDGFMILPFAKSL